MTSIANETTGNVAVKAPQTGAEYLASLPTTARCSSTASASRT